MVLISTVVGFGLVLVELLSHGYTNAQVACILALLVALANCLGESDVVLFGGGDSFALLCLYD